MSLPKTLLATALTLSFASACDDSSDTFESEDASSSFRSSRGTPMNFTACPPHLCGVNAGFAGALSFHLDGEDSLDGLLLLEVYDDTGTPIELHIDGAELFATNIEGETLIGPTLVGTELVFQHVDDLSLTSLFITGYYPDEAESLRFPGEFFPGYEFTFQTDDELEPMPLCGPTPWNDENEGIDPETSAAIVMGGEAFDWWGNSVQGLTDESDAAASWLTIGCSGGAFAKKVLLGYDMSRDPVQRPTHEQNQTMMNLLTARYCGSENYTVTGIDLYWQNEFGEFPVPAGLEIEAIWDHDGAVCLNTPRFAERAEVDLDCGVLPSCDGFNPANYHLVSYNAPGSGV